MQCVAKPSLPEILLVDDDDRIRALLVLSLQEAGFTVVEASRAEAALELLRRGIPALILLDLGMPPGAMSGVELLAQLHEHSPWAGIPVVILSGFGELVNLDAAARLHVRAILQKPVSAADLVGAVRQALES